MQKNTKNAKSTKNLLKTSNMPKITNIEHRFFKEKVQKVPEV